MSKFDFHNRWISVQKLVITRINILYPVRPRIHQSCVRILNYGGLSKREMKAWISPSGKLLSIWHTSICMAILNPCLTTYVDVPDTHLLLLNESSEVPASAQYRALCPKIIKTNGRDKLDICKTILASQCMWAIIEHFSEIFV